jgi:hypothetical protein
MTRVVYLDRKHLTVDVHSAEGRGSRSGLLVVTLSTTTKPVIKTYPFEVSKGTLDHVAFSREKAFALSCIMQDLVEEGFLTREEAEEVILELDWDFHCPYHPLVFQASYYDICPVCLWEQEQEEKEAAMTE